MISLHLPSGQATCMTQSMVSLLVKGCLQALIPAGPYLQFLGYDVSTRQWHGSIAVVLPPLGPEDQRQPVLTFIDEGLDPSLGTRVAAEILLASLHRGNCIGMPAVILRLLVLNMAMREAYELRLLMALARHADQFIRGCCQMLLKDSSQL